MALRYELFEALGDPIRLEIVDRLGTAGEMKTGDLLSDLGVTRQGAAKHLNVLEEAGLIRSRVSGRTIYRELRAEKLDELGVWLQSRARSWDRKLQKLADYLNAEQDPGK